jgi:hypothetical protein
MLAEHLQKVDSAHHPFEFKALEGLLWTMASRQEKRIAYVSRVLTAVMHHSSTHSDEDASEDSPLNQLLPLSTTLGHYELVSRGLLQCVESLMSDPYDLRLAATLSSSEDTKQCRGGEMVEQMEDMLEAIHHSASGTLIAAGEMTRQLGIKRDLLQLQQRAHQNILLSTNLHLQRACIGLSAAMWFTSIFGQNFDHGLGTFGKEALLGSTLLSAMTGVFMFQYFGKGCGGGWGGNSAHAPRLESLQLFLLQLDIRLDGARSTLAAAKRILEGEGDEGTTKSLSKEAFCKLHVEVTPNASLSEAELLFDVLKSGHFSEDLSLDDVLNLEHLLDNASSHTVRAGVSGKTLAKR